MITVCGVKFRSAGKVYYFDPGELNLNLGDEVIVETARGIEYGEISLGNTEVDEKDIVSPLKPIIRIATDEDRKKHIINQEKKASALKSCEEKILKRGLEMKLIDVEFTFDNTKVIFYFTADGRVDFRELVKDLASVFKMRIELRQIGVRDEAKMMGGIGACGRDLCCNSYLSDFEPVSIKMAKVQNLSLNPTKISGICGRLMCCLKYENDIYNDLKKGMPDIGEKVKTKDGMGKVVDVNIFKESVRVRLYNDEHNIKIKDAEDEEDMLSSDIYTYKKSDIKRVEKKKQKKNQDIFEGVNEEELKELKKLMTEE